MKYKQGASWLGSTFVAWIAFTILDYFKPQLISTVLNLKGNSLILILDFLFLSVAGFGVFLILKEKYGWFKKSNTQQHNSFQKQYDYKKLNNEVFRKLMRVACLELTVFFENQVGFCIPKNPMIFKNKTEPAALAYLVEFEYLKEPEKEFDDIKDAIPTLEVGEDYLQQNYNNVYTKWVKIKQELDDLNKDRQTFCNIVSQKIMKELTRHFGTDPKFRLIFPHGDAWAYFSDNVPKIIPSLFRKYEIDFYVENPAENQFYLDYGKYKIIGTNKKDKLNIGAIKFIFKNVTYDEKFKQKERDFYVRLIELNNKISEFCEQLEKKVVNDIDNMV